jgi:hypothetical protein
MTTGMSRLASHYQRLECRYQVEHDDTYRALVVPNGNAERAFHRWFHLKESFSADLFERVLVDAGLGRRRKLTLLDPYAGVGTSLISGLNWANDSEHRAIHAYGIEQNPFMQLVAASKLRAMSKGAADFADFRARLLRRHKRRPLPPAPAPALSTFANTSFFPAGDLTELLRLKAAVDHIDGSRLSKALAQICLAACLEPVSALRRDGRALRHEPRKARPKALAEFERRTAQVVEDVASRVIRARGEVVLGDGRRPDHALPDLKADLVLFSPPYPNNIDYTEVYKLENWFLGFLSSAGEFREQRLRTVRSHPSVLFPPDYQVSDNGYKDEFVRLVAPILDASPSGRYQHQRRRLVRGYFDDMLATLSRLQPLLAQNARVVYVVGNSAHGHGDNAFVIGADIVIAALAEATGFTVEKIIIARRPTRRSVSSTLLRESVVFLRRGA